MNKLKMLVLAGLAAATVGVGALASAPSASAESNCDYYENKAIAYDNTATILFYLGNYTLGNRYLAMSTAYEGAWEHCLGYK